jgi:hypothetical protein
MFTGNHDSRGSVSGQDARGWKKFGSEIRVYLREIGKFTVSTWGWGTAVSSLVASILAFPLIVLLGGIPSLTDIGITYVAIYLTTSALLLFLVVSPFLMWQAQRRVDARRVAEIARLEDEIQHLKRPAELPPMSLREAAVHLHGLVKRFVELPDFQKRFDAVDTAVRDALSVGPLTATGRPKDWLDEMTGHSVTRTEISRDFWRKESGRIDWWSAGSEDPYEQATARNRDDVHVFYDVEFDRAALLKGWPADDKTPLGFLQLAELADGCLAYDFTGGKRSHNNSFIQGVRQAARRGDLNMLGRAKAYDAQKQFADSYPLEPIPAAHFSEWTIVVPACELRRGDDWDIITSKPSANHEECYRDLHYKDREQALKWLLSFKPTRLEPSNEDDGDS